MSVPAASIPGFQSSLVVLTQPVEVTTPSGQKIRVLGTAEEDFYNSQARQYQDENGFTNASDLLDLDRLLFLELLVFRTYGWIAQGYDYDGGPIDRMREHRNLKETSALISTVKADLGLTKSARDKAQGESVGAYLTILKQRAREFGIHRENQLASALVLMQQLFAIIGAFDRSDPIERHKIGFEDEAEIVDWIRTVMKPEYQAIDEHFRNRPGGQRLWVHEL